MHRLLLIQPPFYRLFHPNYSIDVFPLGLAYLAGAVRQETDWQVQCYIADFTPDFRRLSEQHLAGPGYHEYLKALQTPDLPIWAEVRRVLEEYQPDVVGISATSPTFASVRRVAVLAKQVRKDVVVVVGGPHPSTVGAQALQCDDIDVCVRGEGERTLVELLKTLGQGPTLNGVAGTIYRRGQHVVENPARGYIQDLDGLPFPHTTAPQVLRDYRQYPPSCFRSISATRGCANNCLFCGSREIWSRNVRFRSPQNVVAEIQGLQSKGLNFLHFVDDTFGVTKSYLTELCGAIRQNCPGLEWSCTFHVQLADPETISLMKEAGCCRINLGIESGNDQVLQAIRKSTTVEKSLQACRIIKDSGISLGIFILIGLPMETEQAIRDTIAFTKRLPSDDIIFSIFTPYPGTEAFEYCRSRGLIPADFDVSLYNHQSPANCFSERIPQARFRQLTLDVARTVERTNYRRHVARLLALRQFKRLRQLGVTQAMYLGLRTLLGKR